MCRADIWAPALVEKNEILESFGLPWILKDMHFSAVRQRTMLRRTNARQGRSSRLGRRHGPRRKMEC